MDKWTRDTSAALRDMSSSQAADWLLANYPREGDKPGVAVKLLAHLSLHKADNLRLAEHYLAGPTWAHEWPYEVFAKCLGVRRLVSTLEKVVFDTNRDHSLLHYHICRLQRTFKSDRDVATIQGMIDRLSAN